MKKLILVLSLVAMTAFLLVGCTPGVTPVEPPIAGIDCPTSVVVEGQLAVAGKNYVQGGIEKTITVTFAVPTAPVSVYVGYNLTKAVPTDAEEVVMYSTDNKVYTGSYTFDNDSEYDCTADYIYVETCGTCSACKYPYTVDNQAPVIDLTICGKLAACGCGLTFTSTGGTCDPMDTCDDCVGLASWNIDIYENFPDFEVCGCTPCEEPIDSGSGTACPVSWTSGYKFDTTTDTAWAVVTLVDALGNSIKYGYEISLGDSCEILGIKEMAPVEDCLDTAPPADICAPCTQS